MRGADIGLAGIDAAAPALGVCAVGWARENGDVEVADPAEKKSDDGVILGEKDPKGPAECG